jgi:RNA polymerase sigma-70 factor (ECF subfamily)
MSFGCFLTQRPEIPSQFVGLLLQAEPRVYAYIRSQVPHRPDAEDVLQETVGTLWAKFQEFRPGSNFLAWAYEVARHKVQHYYRQKGRENRVFCELFVEQIADRAEEMADELSGLQAALRDCLGKLRPADRDVVNRCYATKATIAGVAAQLGRPLDTIKSVLKRSRRALYECVSRTLARERTT